MCISGYCHIKAKGVQGSQRGVNYASVSKYTEIHDVCTHTHTHTNRQSKQLPVTPRGSCSNHSRGDKEATLSRCRIATVTADVSLGKELE